MGLWNLVKDAFSSGAVSAVSDAYYTRKAQTAEDEDDRKRAENALMIGSFFTSLANYRNKKQLNTISMDYSDKLQLNDTGDLLTTQTQLNNDYKNLLKEASDKYRDDPEKRNIALKSIKSKYDDLNSGITRESILQQRRDQQQNNLNKMKQNDAYNNLYNSLTDELDKINSSEMSDSQKRLESRKVIGGLINKVDDPKLAKKIYNDAQTYLKGATNIPLKEKTKTSKKTELEKTASKNITKAENEIEKLISGARNSDGSLDYEQLNNNEKLFKEINNILGITKEEFKYKEGDITPKSLDIISKKLRQKLSKSTDIFSNKDQKELINKETMSQLKEKAVNREEIVKLKRLLNLAREQNNTQAVAELEEALRKVNG